MHTYTVLQALATVMGFTRSRRPSHSQTLSRLCGASLFAHGLRESRGWQETVSRATMGAMAIQKQLLGKACDNGRE